MNTKQMTEFRAVVLQCSSGQFNSINVASKTRSDAIVAAWDEIERLRKLLAAVLELAPKKPYWQSDCDTVALAHKALEGGDE